MVNKTTWFTSSQMWINGLDFHVRSVSILSIQTNACDTVSWICTAGRPTRAWTYLASSYLESWFTRMEILAAAERLAFYILITVNFVHYSYSIQLPSLVCSYKKNPCAVKMVLNWLEPRESHSYPQCFLTPVIGITYVYVCVFRVCDWWARV